MRLEHSLILNQYCHHLLGADDLSELKQALFHVQEGTSGDGQSFFLGTLIGRRGLRVDREALRRYDANIMAYEQRLSRKRGVFQFKYFQYLALLYTEMYLDRLTADPDSFLTELNVFLHDRQQDAPHLRELPDFVDNDLRRLAFFMATGSGKTLVMHVNFWQALHYLENGRHPEALVRRTDNRHEFDNIILITPNEGLSQQHLKEFDISGIQATPLIQGHQDRGMFGPVLRVIEISKLAEEASGEGLSIPIDELGDANLVFVDEGHKGTGSEGQKWKSRQKKLSANGLLLEYSATFAQAIGAASRRAQANLVEEYGKAILFDYSYRHFYDDGYGKDFSVLNLSEADEGHAYDLLVNGLLVYLQQLLLFEDRKYEFHQYNLERPLWVFLGSSVNAVYQRKGQKQSDVATVVGFLKKFLEEPEWARERLQVVLDGKSGFSDGETGHDLFVPLLEKHLLADFATAEQLYEAATSRIFHGRGALEVVELKNADGELGLRVSISEGSERPFFGVINIGDVPEFRRHLERQLDISVLEDRFTPSLFANVNAPDSPLNIVVGSKKFIEGWSSWRVSSMGLLNIGKGEGPQVIQLFGRGVRLKGKDWSLKRSKAVADQIRLRPEGLDHLETLYIFGWNADYIQSFQQMLEHEELPVELLLQVRRMEPWPADLPLPCPSEGFDATTETWTLCADDYIKVSVNTCPQVMAMAGKSVRESAEVGTSTLVDFKRPVFAELVNHAKLYTDLVEYKNARKYGNVFIDRDALRPILKQSELRVPQRDMRNPDSIQEGATRILCSYLDRFVALKERTAEHRHICPGALGDAARFVPTYSLRITSKELVPEIQSILDSEERLYRDGDTSLPRLYLDRHLYSPLLLSPEEYGLDELAISPAGLVLSESIFVKHLRAFWDANKDKPEYKDYEIFLLRNPSRRGVGFFVRSGFYPDFILWARDRATDSTRVIFVEPHSMAFGGLYGKNADKVEALRQLTSLSGEPEFYDRRITLAGFILTRTPKENIEGAEELTWDKLAQDCRVMRQDEEGAYIRSMLAER